MRPLTLAYTALIALLVLGFSTGCASSGSGGKGKGAALRVTMRQGSDGSQFELVSKSHTDPVEYYSQTQDKNGRKVQNDEIMAELVKRLDSLDFSEIAQAGHAPKSLGASALFSIEVENKAGVRHAMEVRGADVGQRRKVREMINSFLAVYNSTLALQSVTVEEGENPFRKSER